MGSSNPSRPLANSGSLFFPKWGIPPDGFVPVFVAVGHLFGCHSKVMIPTTNQKWSGGVVNLKNYFSGNNMKYSVKVFMINILLVQ